jgi:mRNA interferase HicA
MKRRELVRLLEERGCEMKREGGSHTIYWNPATGRREPVPRHSEIPDILARKICRCLGVSWPSDERK